MVDAGPGRGRPGIGAVTSPAASSCGAADGPLAASRDGGLGGTPDDPACLPERSSLGATGWLALGG
ncbi:MAG: hypothetical protein JO100_05630 [Pseudonocardia sp.]|nr:hypothetical protein [Pseudonocardia sp.]